MNEKKYVYRFLLDYMCNLTCFLSYCYNKLTENLHCP